MSDDNGHSCCRQIAALLKAQKKVIVDHLEEHKWFRHIPDENQGVMAFIEEYGWIMREMYCGYACPDRHQCKIAENFLPLDERERISEIINQGEKKDERKDEQGYRDRNDASIGSSSSVCGS